MKVNSNLWQHVSSFHERNVAIPLEFPQELLGLHIGSKNLESVQEQFILLTHGLQATHKLGELNVEVQNITSIEIQN